MTKITIYARLKPVFTSLILQPLIRNACRIRLLIKVQNEELLKDLQS